MVKKYIPFIIIIISLFSWTEKVVNKVQVKNIEAPKPLAVVPSKAKLAWHDMEFYAFVHFTINTFTDKEWGYGDESPKLFNPTDLDCNQWAKVAKEAGMKGIIFTAKHHDGFCLWPSEYTEHSIKNSPYKNGKGDLIKELSDACEKEGLKMGLYLSPWDRNSAVYGKPEYITYYRNQLREILSNYGEVYEIWFDGANGGDGYYGGANEERKIDRVKYYDWENTRKIVRELQPKALMFSDGGPGCRWVGNEFGFAGETNWCTLNGYEFYPGSPNSAILPYGHENGTDWIPAECDVSIRPGWFYHQNEDSLVKTTKDLMEIYYKSVGRNGNLLLNLPVDRTGQVNKYDVKALKAFRKALDREFSVDLAKGKDVKADSWRGNNPKYKPSNITDGNKETYWCTDDGIKTGSLTIDFNQPTEVNRIVLQEYIKFGQRVRTFNVEAFINGKWEVIGAGSTIGHKRILKLPTVKTDKIKVNILSSKACPLINNVEIYRAPDK